VSRRVIQNSAETFVAGIVAFGLAAVTAVVIARWLGPEGKGTYSTLQMLAAFIGAVTSGAGSSITYLLTRQREPIAEILPALGTVLAAVTVLAWLGLIGWSLAFGATVPLAVLAAVIPAVVVLSWRQSFFVGMGRLRDLNRQIVLVAVATFVATTGAVIVLHGNVGGALAAWALCQYAAATVVVAEGLRTGRGQPRASLRHNVDRIVRYGSQAGLNSLLGLLAYRIDSLVLLTLLGTATLGVYSVAVTMCEQLLWISRPVTLSVVRDIGSHDLAASGAVASRVMRLCSTAVGLAALVMFVVGPMLIELLYGAQFGEATVALRILLPGIVAFSTAGTFASFFMFQLGRPLIVTAINLVMIAVQMGACFVLIPRLGAEGAALASSATYVLGASLNTWRFCRATGLGVADVWIVRADDIRRVLAEWPGPRFGLSKT
jgi:O-antigen/teichoic acid export membrane protein